VRYVFAVLFLASALFAGGFAIRLGPPWKSPEPVMAWLQAALAWVAVAFNTAWALVTLAVHVPLWVFGLILLAEDAVFGWRWWELERSRRT
jgi:hypothetical protein